MAGLGQLTLHVPTGCYELKAINAEIIRLRGNSDITILPNVNTLQCILTVVGAKCKVSFDVPNSLASVLGFERSIYGVGRHASENLVNIISVNSILIHCTIIHSSYILHGQQYLIESIRIILHWIWISWIGYSSIDLFRAVTTPFPLPM